VGDALGKSRSLARRAFVRFLASLAFVLPFVTSDAQERRIGVAVFPVELWDTSGEGMKPGRDERLALATRTLARLLEEQDRYRSLDLSPFAARIAATEPRYACNGCWRQIAIDAGAETAALAVVHKVSTLISTVDIYLADVPTGMYVAHAQGQFRGDDDRAYVRAFEFLTRHRLSTNAAGSPAPGR
jgi:hypothetical protein